MQLSVDEESNEVLAIKMFMLERFVMDAYRFSRICIGLLCCLLATRWWPDT